MSELKKYKKKLKKAEQRILLLEDMVETHTRELYLKNSVLERTNSEMEQFAYIASHDLQEPLRVLCSFVELLDKSYRGRLDPNADLYLHYIADSTKHLQNLIRGLLDFSRLGKLEDSISTDCNLVVNKILNELECLIKRKKAIVTYDHLPRVDVNAFEFQILLKNLISNGIKFSRPDTNPQVHISAEKKSNMWEFKIQDNGIGIDSKHYQRIFLIFQRLHSRVDHEGSGIGLAYCKKIVALHGGEIWVKSLENMGSEFYFTIPSTN